MQDMTSIISIQNLSKTYASGPVALKDVSFDIERGEILALLGPNGAGKTTLISISVRAQQGEYFATFNVKRHVFQRHRSGGVGLREILN